MARAVAQGVLDGAHQGLLRLAHVDLRVGGDGLPLGEALQQALTSRDPGDLQSLESAVEGALQEPAARLSTARQRAAAAAGRWLTGLGVPRHADAGPEGGCAEAAAARLAASDELFLVASEHAHRRAGAGGAGWIGPLRALSGADQSAIIRPRERFRRGAEFWKGLELSEPLGRTVVVGDPHGLPWPTVHVLQGGEGRVGQDVRTRLSAGLLEWGLASELAALAGVGRAAALAFASPALPVETRVPAVASVARTLGLLASLSHTDPVYLRRERGISRAQAEELARRASAWVLAQARLAWAVLQTAGDGPEALVDSATRGARRALGCELSQSVSMLAHGSVSPGGAARAWLVALELYATLREQHDEDWYRNPRCARVLRGASAQGGEIAVEMWAAELGVCPVWEPEVAGRPGAGLERLQALF